jgi:hypothetical protein
MVMLARRPPAIAVDEPTPRGRARALRRALALCSCAAVIGCGHAPPVPVTVLVDGDAEQAAAVRRLLANAAVEDLQLRAGTIAPPADAELGAAEVAAAYQDFIAGDGSRCRERLSAVDLPRLLAHRQRTVVARALLLDARCADGLGATAAADARFAEFAGYELDLAETSGVLSPSLRPRFDRALAAAGVAARVRLSVDGAPGGRVLIDGRLAGCAAPCAPAVSAGVHVVSIESDGASLAWKQLTIEPTGAPSVSLPRAAASAAEATQQWHARVGSGFAADDAVGLRLLPLMAKDDRVAYLRVTAAARSGVPTLVGAMAVRQPGQEATLSARGQRLTLEAAPQLVRQLAIDTKVIASPRPRWFWPVLVGSVVVTAAVTAVLLYQPETRTEVSF